MNKKYDLAVIGGGLTGVAAAVSAAREGLNVLLVEKEGSLGGAMSGNLVYPFMRYWTTMEDGSRKDLSAGIFTQMRKRQAQKAGCDEMTLKPEYFKLILDDMICEAGVDVLFHTLLVGVETKEKKISSVTVANKSGMQTIESRFFIDATGDGELFAMAGCDYQLGRDADGLCQPMTTCFRLSGVDIEQYIKDSKYLNDLYKQYKEEGKITNPRENILVFEGIGAGVLHFNTTRIVKMDPTNAFDVSKAEVEARRQVYEMVTFLKEHSTAFADSDIVSIASEIGIRESRKLRGVHVLNQEELKACTKFEDTIALGNYDIDIHNPSGSGTSHYYFADGEYYGIPYRSLLPKEYDNLLVAGRCLSATHEAQASVRIMPICACIGEAAGTAVSIACKTGRTTHTVDVQALRNRLRDNGAAVD